MDYLVIVKESRLSLTTMEFSSGIVHDDPPCSPDPDVAGIGVVCSYVVAASLTTGASIAAALFDEMLEADTAYLPKRFNARLSVIHDARRATVARLWRNTLDRFILSLADQQLVTGFALLLTGWIAYHDDLYGAHFNMVIYLSCLSSSSHLAAIITLRKYFGQRQRLAVIRIVIIAAFALLLAASISVSSAFGPFYGLLELVTQGALPLPVALSYLLAAFPIVWSFWTGIWQIVPDHQKRFRHWLEKHLKEMWLEVKRAYRLDRFRRLQAPRGSRARRLLAWSGRAIAYLVFLSPGSVFVLQIVFALISLVMALIQKFDPGIDGECSLNSMDENKMGYGQVLAVLLLTLPALAIIEAYKDEQHATRLSDASNLQSLPFLRLSVQHSLLSGSPNGTEFSGSPVDQGDLEQHPSDTELQSPSRRDTEQGREPAPETSVSTSVSNVAPTDSLGMVSRRNTTLEASP